MKPLRRLSDRTADRLVRGYAVPEEPVLAAFVTQLAALVPDAAPTPSDRLTALLEQGPPVNTNALVPQYAKAKRSGLALRRLSLGAVGVMGVVLAAASMNTLPGPAQTVVSDVVGFVTPIDLPKPHHAKPGPAPATDPTVEPGEAPAVTPHTPLPRESSDPSPEASESTGQDGTNGGADATPQDSPEPQQSDQPTDEPTDGSGSGPSDGPSDGSTASGDSGGYQPANGAGSDGSGLNPA